MPFVPAVLRAGTLGLALACLAAGSVGAAPPEVRGLWVVRTGLVSPEAVDQVVDQAREGGINTLLVQVRGRGDAFYNSRIVSRSTLLENRPRDFDPLARLLERAHARGITVHAWINVLLTAHFGQALPAGHILMEQPEWVMVPRSAARAALSTPPSGLLALVGHPSRRTDVEGYYLTPSAPGVAAHLESVVREIVRTYPVDGLHLDFIRYPNREFDYSRQALEAFRAVRGGKGDPLAAVEADAAAWDDFRRSSITSLADRLARAAKGEQPGLLVSAAVVPSEVDAIQQKFQAWPDWLARRVIDVVCPMTYTPDRKVFAAQVTQAQTRLRPGQSLWAGVGAYRLPFEGIVENIAAARRIGASGFVLFSHESLDARALRRLKDEAFDTSGVAAGSR